MAGPFHPAIRQLVESELITEQIIKLLELENVNSIKVVASGRNISLIAGNKGVGKNI